MKNKKELARHLHYAHLLTLTIAAILDKDSDSEHHIDLQELGEGENFACFLHALANTIPTFFYNKLASESLSYLEFNHMANNLCFKFCMMED